MLESKYHTKDWRKEQEWWVGGRKNECENYQRNNIEITTKLPCTKSNKRLNMRNYELKEHINPCKYKDGFDWSEDFDGEQTINTMKLMYNMKFVCGKGGAQTRTLREVYHFINSQIGFLKRGTANIYFVNILDGDESYRVLEKFKYIISDNDNIFCGDSYNFNIWFNLKKEKII